MIGEVAGIEGPTVRAGGRGRSSVHIRRHILLGLRLVVVFAFAGLTACVSAPGRSRQEAHFASLLAEMPPVPAEDMGDNRPTSYRDHHLHIAGLVECGGFFRKTQTVYAEAWTTHPGEEGPPVELPGLEIRLDYFGGVFDGMTRRRGGKKADRVRLSDVTHGNFHTDLCSCAKFVATVKVPPTETKLRTRIKVCPES